MKTKLRRRKKRIKRSIKNFQFVHLNVLDGHGQKMQQIHKVIYEKIVVNSASCERMFCWGNFPPALESIKLLSTSQRLFMKCFDVQLIPLINMKGLHKQRTSLLKLISSQYFNNLSLLILLYERPKNGIMLDITLRGSHTA